MLDRRDLLKLGAATTVGAGLVTGSAGAQDGTETGTETGTPTGTETGQGVTLTGNLYAAARMSGQQRVPPVETQATGATVFTNEGEGRLGYEIYVAGIQNVTMAHIHLGPRGESGPVVQWLYPSADATEPQPIQGESNGLLVRGTITGENLTGPLEGESLSALVEAMQAGNTYVNVHTEEHPEGAIRGQIVVVQGAPPITAEVGETPAEETTTGTDATTETGTPVEDGTTTEAPGTTTDTGTPVEDGTTTGTPEGTPTNGTPEGTPTDGTPAGTPEGTPTDGGTT